MHEAVGMHLISICTGNEVGSSYVLAFGSWITFVSCNALGETLHIGIGDRTMDNGKQLIILIVMMIIDSYQRLKDPYIIGQKQAPGRIHYLKRGLEKYRACSWSPTSTISQIPCIN